MAEIKTVVTGDIQTDYTVFGSGPKIFVILPGLSVHSITSSAFAIETAYKVFTEEYTVYVFDRPEPLEKGCTVHDLAVYTAMAMKALGLENADVFGVSQGGMMAEYLAADYPELVNRLILGSSAARINCTFAGILEDWKRFASGKNGKALAESFADSVYSEATLKEYRDVIISMNGKITYEEYGRFMILAESCEGFDCTAELSRIKCPVLVIGSKGDRIMTAAASEELAEKLKCELYLYGDGYGHAVYDEAPDYKQRCLDFLRK